MKAAVCKHPLEFVLFLAFISLLLVKTGFSSGSKHRTLRRYSPELQHYRGHREASIKAGPNSRSHAKANQYSTKDKPTYILGPRNYTNITGQTDTNIVLTCLLGDVENTTVMWLKRQSENDTNIDIITIGNKTYSKDQRFLPECDSTCKKWTLSIRYAKINDAGIYECKVPTHPPTSVFTRLKLVESVAEIIGEKHRHVKPLAPLRLTCILHNSLEKPTYIFWYHWDRMINYDLGDGATVRTGRSESELIFPRAEPKHAGNYSCVPSNARQDTVYVSIAHSDLPTAMQQGCYRCSRIGLTWNLTVCMLIYLLTYQHPR